MHEFENFIELHGSAEVCAMLLQIATDNHEQNYYTINREFDLMFRETAWEQYHIKQDWSDYRA